jgi:2-keto-4-pentenoate hydratase/2-oxohepta-3-ene-1,7-dioic acid hydratase in catechol pathway
MRLISYRSGGENKIGVRAGDAIVDVAAAHAASGADGDLPTDIIALLELGDDGLEAARAAGEYGADKADLHAPEDLELLPLVPRPPKIICVARNYGAHAAEAGLNVLEHPNLFIRFPQSLLADGEAIEVPAVSEQVDWEAELAVVIGKSGKHISQDDAYDYIAGYALFNDVSIRDWQLRVKGGQFGAGKNFDASGPFGPDLVTKNEVEDPMNLAISLRVNGETKQESNTNEMIFSIPVLIEFISKFTTLEPGDVIATGTPSGVGHFRKPPEYLKDGDSVEVEIETIGVQRNPVVAEVGVPAEGAVA